MTFLKCTYAHASKMSGRHQSASEEGNSREGLGLGTGALYIVKNLFAGQLDGSVG